jgi:S1-C subfamily serine protease
MSENTSFNETLNPDFSMETPVDQIPARTSLNELSRPLVSKIDDQDTPKVSHHIEDQATPTKDYFTPPKKSSFHPIRFISNLFKTIGAIVMILVITIAGISIYVAIKPEEKVSKDIKSFVATNTTKTIEKKVDSNSNQSTNPENVVETKKIEVNNSVPFSFSQPKDARTTTDVVQSVLPSVLSISLSQKTLRSNQQDLVSGTGYIVTEDGIVVTNKHVIAKKCSVNAQSVSITASNSKQEAFELELLSVDPVDDIAILKIIGNTQKFQKVSFADSNNLLLGSDVIAIGNALGELQNSVTRGVVSGLNRNIGTGLDDECTGGKTGASDNLIQTDAAINPGNSGGPLFDPNGNVIGMNTLGTSSAQNIGLAIPANNVVSALNSFQKNGSIIRPRLGVYTQSITPIEKKQNSWIPIEYGEVILSPTGNQSAVGANTAASKAGLKDGDIILSVDGVKLTASNQNPSPLRRVILTKQAGDQITLSVLKTKQETSDGYTYNQSPTEIAVTLGKISFDLNKDKISNL